MFYFMIRQKTGRIPASGQGTSSQGVSGTDWSQSVNVSSPNGDDVIMIYPETEESEEQSGDLGETEGAASQMQPDQKRHRRLLPERQKLRRRRKLPQRPKMMQSAGSTFHRSPGSWMNIRKQEAMVCVSMI